MKYMKGNARIEKLKVELDTKRNAIVKKRDRLPELKAECDSEEVGEHSQSIEKDEISQRSVDLIEQQLSEGEEFQMELLAKIAESESEQKRLIECLNVCIGLIKDKIKYMEWEEDVVLQEKGLGPSQRKPYDHEKHLQKGITAGSLLGAGAGVALSAGVAGIHLGGLFAGASILGND